jgi:hypothetical protein
MKRMLPPWGGLAVVAATVLLAACSNDTSAHVPRRNGSPAPGVTAAGRSARPYLLLTHCGIDEARIGGRYFEAAHPLSDGHGNPPAGWGNPFQRGTITLLSPTQALFHDHADHHVLFRLRPGATTFKHLCS